MPNYYKCSDGSKVSEATVKRKLSEAYRAKYEGEPLGLCEGCGARQPNGSAHIIPKTRCKYDLNMTELIWHPVNFFRACNQCNSAIENPGGTAWKDLLNLDHCLYVIEKYDKELYQKFMNNL